MHNSIFQWLSVQCSRVLLATAIGALVLTSFPRSVQASTWSPTLLVNTESFQVIDEGDGTTDIEIRFGDTLDERFYWDRSDSVFRLTDDLTVEGTLSGQALRVSGPADVHGALTASGAFRTDDNITINDDQTAADAVLTFGKSGGTETFTFSDANQIFELSDALRATGNITSEGTLSGAALRVSGPASVHGALSVSGSTTVEGTISGASLVVTDLKSCNTIDTDANGNLICGTDDSGSDWSGTGALQTAFDDRYVNQSGDTMTGNLIIGNAATLSVSGSIVTEANLTINEDQTAADAVLTFGKSGGTETFTFSDANQIFELSDALRATGNITSEGTLSGAALRVSGPASVHGALSVSGSTTVEGTISGASLVVTDLKSCNTIDTDANGNLICGTDDGGSDWSGTGALQTAFDDRYVNQSGDTMTGNLIIGNAATLSVSGAIITEGNLTINEDQTAADAILTFGSDGTNETLTFANTADRFEFSDDVSVIGVLSGSSLRVDQNADIWGNATVSGSLTVDGTTTFNGVTYTWPGATAAASGNVLSIDPGTGQLTWTDLDSAVSNSSGSIISMFPEYPNTIYQADGSNNVGQLTLTGASFAENLYRWTSTRPTLQDYDLHVRVRVPDNFASWDPTAGVQLQYRTGLAASANNAVTMTVYDTDDASDDVNAAAASTSFTTHNATAAELNGTYTPGDYMTVIIKVAANSTANAFADLSYLNFNWETTTP